MADVIKDFAGEAQADLGMDYAWLDDVTYMDWQASSYFIIVDTFADRLFARHSALSCSYGWFVSFFLLRDLELSTDLHQSTQGIRSAGDLNSKWLTPIASYQSC